MKDYFNTLGVAAGASNDEIKKAYKKLAMTHHPDRGGDQAKFQEIQEAYDTLSDPQKRAQWEQQRHFGNQQHHSFNFGFGADINDIFRQFTGGASPFGGFRQQPKNRDIRMGIEIDLAATLEKQMQHINVKHTNGTVKTVEIEIPRGIQTGMQMRFPGQGDHTHQEFPAGDLYVDFRVRPNSDFRVSGINLTKTISLNCIDAILGTQISVAGLDGTQFDITVPPATQNQTKFRVSQHGLWDINQPIRGDLYFEVSIYIPDVVSSDQILKLQQK